MRLRRVLVVATSDTSQSLHLIVGRMWQSYLNCVITTSKSVADAFRRGWSSGRGAASIEKLRSSAPILNCGARKRLEADAE